jgi:hypothetical protein
VLYIDVAKVKQDVAHVVMTIHICFKCMFQMFHLFHTYVAVVLSVCCKSRSTCCIYMHVPSICFQVFLGISYVCKCFIWMLHIFAMVFKCFSGFFASVSFHTLVSSVSSVFFYVASGCFKSRLSVFIWDARGKRLTARTMFGVVRVTPGAARPHYWCIRS